MRIELFDASETVWKVEFLQWREVKPKEPRTLDKQWTRNEISIWNVNIPHRNTEMLNRNSIDYSC